MIWAQRIFTLLIIVVISYVLYYLALRDNGDATLIAILAGVFNIVVYFIGRSDHYAEHNTTLH